MWVPESTGAGARHLTHLRRDVVDDVVVVGRRYPSGHVVESQRMARFPGHRMVGTGGVAAAADGADALAFLVVDRQPAAKNVDAADRLSNHGVLGARAIMTGIAR